MLMSLMMMNMLMTLIGMISISESLGVLYAAYEITAQFSWTYHVIQKRQVSAILLFAG